jgi:hypothetical protein
MQPVVVRWGDAKIYFAAQPAYPPRVKGLQK